MKRLKIINLEILLFSIILSIISLIANAASINFNSNGVPNSRIISYEGGGSLIGTGIDIAQVVGVSRGKTIIC